MSRPRAQMFDSNNTIELQLTTNGKKHPLFIKGHWLYIISEIGLIPLANVTIC